MTFTLDTDGAIYFATPYAKKHGLLTNYRWEDLPPFVQGCINALFVSERDPKYDTAAFEDARRSQRCFPMDDAEGTIPSDAGFSDLQNLALETILRDCAAFLKAYPKVNRNHPDDYIGYHFWAGRQLGVWAPDFPPLTAHFSSDGKVELRERAL